MKRIGKGKSGEVFLLDDDKILKLFYSKPGLGWENEIRVNRKLLNTKLPVPRLIKNVEIENRLGLVYERIRGVSMLAAIRNRPTKAFFIASTLADLHSEIHKISGEGLPSFKKALEKNIFSSQYVSKKAKNAALKHLETLPDDDLLCHGDLNLKNVIITVDGPVIIDWAMARKGPPSADVFCTSYLLSLAFTNNQRFKEKYLERYFEKNPQSSLEQVEAWRKPILTALTNFWGPKLRKYLINDLKLTK
jgi:aminoglycoside phosphotransferase (APT) family kinase protein